METLNRTMSEQTQRLVKGLEYLLKAREEIYSSFTGAYGEEQGEKMYCDSGYSTGIPGVLILLK